MPLGGQKALLLKNDSPNPIQFNLGRNLSEAPRAISLSLSQVTIILPKKDFSNDCFQP
jgi:hypothetical protein